MGCLGAGCFLQFAKGGKGGTGAVSVDDLDGVRIVREVTPAGSWGKCPALHPGEGILSVETDRPPLVLIARMLGYEKGHEHEDGTRQVEEPGAGAARRQMRRQSSAFATSEAIMSDPASVVDHEARHMRPAELFDEALKSYFDVSIAAALVSRRGIIGVSGVSRVVGATGRQRPPPTNPILRSSLRPYTRVVLVSCARLSSSILLSTDTHTRTNALTNTPQVSIPCILFVFMLAESGPYLEGGDDHTSGGASLYSLGNHTITNTTLCPEMGGLDSQRGATLDAQKIFALTGGVYLGVWSIATNSLALVRHRTPKRNVYY